VENYFNYFTEIEERFQRRRGGALLLSTLDWALIETWKDAGIPLAAVLRGIDAAFDAYDSRPAKTRKVNSLAYCAQEVLSAAEQMKEAAVGTNAGEASGPRAAGFDPAEIARFLRSNAGQLQAASLPAADGITLTSLAAEAAGTLQVLADELESEKVPARLEDVERRLTVLEQKLLSALQAATPDEALGAIRGQAERELAPYRRKMPAAQIQQLLSQFLQKRLLEKYGLPRLSLFYM
jgi:hypothetical protein